MKSKKENRMALAERKAAILKALAHPARVIIFEALAEGEKTVGELVEILGAKESNTSRHLALLRAAELVSTRKEGLNIYYSIKFGCLLSTLKCIDDGVCEIADDHKITASIVRRKKINKGKRK